MSEPQELAARREQFIRTAAHDLRNPIAALIGYAALIETGSELDDENRYFLARLRETAAKLHDATAGLIELAWLEAEMPLNHAPVDLGAAVASVVEALTPLAQEKGIALSVSAQEALPRVMGDEERLHAAIHRLLHNAIHYSGDGKNVSVRLWEADGDVFCSVTDVGIGVAEDEIETVFDRLYRSRDARVKALPGGGVGLTVARRVAQQQGGDVTVVSKLDEGSTFTLRLPSQ